MSTRQSGASLIEVLITVLILAIGLLGLAALQARSMQYNHGSALRSQANIFASDILDRMRLNRNAAISLAYNLSYEAAKPTGSTVAQTDLQQWRDLVTSNLPSGGSAVRCAANGDCTISIQWRERAGSEIAPADEETQSSEFSEFVYSTRI